MRHLKRNTMIMRNIDRSNVWKTYKGIIVRQLSVTTPQAKYACSINSQHVLRKCNRYNAILTCCNRVMKSEVRRSPNIVSDMNAKCQYYVRPVLNHDFVNDLLMILEKNREVSSRPSCALTSNKTAMQNIIIPLKNMLFE